MARRTITHRIAHIGRNRQRGAVIRRVATHLGLLYFGALSHDDDHDVIRGLTVSLTHEDRHFVTGTFDGYDLSIVDRDDVLQSGKNATHRRWVIIQVPLRHSVPVHDLMVLPHTTLSLYTHALAGIRQVQPIEELVSDAYSPEFLSRYTLMAASHYALDVQRVFTPALADLVALKFWPHAIEVKDRKVLVYITEDRLNETVLRVAVESALWLADSIDQRV